MLEIVEGSALAGIDKTVTQGGIERYAQASGDFNPVHLDEEFAAGTQFGGRIAHGMMILAFLSEMLSAAFRHHWAQSGSLKVRFRGAVKPGDTVTTYGTIKKVAHDDNVRIVTCSVGVKNQHGDAVITGDASVGIPDETL